MKLLFPINFVVAGLLFVLTHGIGSAQETDATRYFLIGNSLTWDTVPSKLDGDTQWHVDCGKSLPFIVEHPEEPCVKSSTLWPKALKEKKYDVIVLQVHYGSMLEKDVAAVFRLLADQPSAKIVIHTGWARSADRASEWSHEASAKPPSATPMQHNVDYFDRLLKALRTKYPMRHVSRTAAMDVLQQVQDDVAANKAPIADVKELYRDKIHMNVVFGRYLMHNAMRHAIGQSRSSRGFEKLDPEMKTYFDSVLDRVLASQRHHSSI